MAVNSSKRANGLGSAVWAVDTTHPEMLVTGPQDEHTNKPLFEDEAPIASARHADSRPIPAFSRPSYLSGWIRLHSENRVYACGDP
jgi:hypothetical protein